MPEFIMVVAEAEFFGGTVAERSLVVEDKLLAVDGLQWS